MALSNAERQRRYYKRKKEKLKNADDVTKPLLQRTFADYLAVEVERLEAIGWIEQEIGLDLNFIETSSDNSAVVEAIEHRCGALITSLETLCGLLNEYKTEELESKLATASGPERKKIAKYAKQLQRKFRLTLDEFEVKEI
jgi:hypothetical protein